MVAVFLDVADDLTLIKSRPVDAVARPANGLRFKRIGALLDRVGPALCKLLVAKGRVTKGDQGFCP
jgi:hypothetical protein